MPIFSRGDVMAILLCVSSFLPFIYDPMQRERTANIDALCSFLLISLHAYTGPLSMIQDNLQTKLEPNYTDHFNNGNSTCCKWQACLPLEYFGLDVFSTLNERQSNITSVCSLPYINRGLLLKVSQENNY